MDEYLKLQKDAQFYYAMYCEERRNNGYTDKADYWHDMYHFTRVKMDECKRVNNLEFCSPSF
jgi:hypothetical protein